MPSHPDFFTNSSPRSNDQPLGIMLSPMDFFMASSSDRALSLQIASPGVLNVKPNRDDGSILRTWGAACCAPTKSKPGLVRRRELQPTGASYHAALRVARETFRNKSKGRRFVSLSCHVTSNY